MVSIDVAVVVQGSPASPTLRDVFLSACSDALKHRVCVDEDNSAPSSPAAHPDTAASTLAIVTWPDGDLRRVRIVLEKRDALGNRTLSQETRFGIPVDQHLIGSSSWWGFAALFGGQCVFP